MKISIVGAGNVATYFAVACHHAGHEVSGIYARNYDRAAELAGRVDAAAGSIHDVNQDADVYLLAVSDDALPEIAEGLRRPGAVVAHCAGSLPMSLLLPVSADAGVIWPFYSIQDASIGLEDRFPVILDGASPKARSALAALADSLRMPYQFLSYEKRQAAHLAAVFSNNFVNHLWALADSLALESGFSFDLLRPIMQQTLQKALLHGPVKSQTGPALRDDRSTLEKHRRLLAATPLRLRVYESLTESIQTFYDNQNDHD